VKLDGWYFQLLKRESSLRRLRQEDLQFKASLSYTARLNKQTRANITKLSNK
jgi:hypothetical protein